MLDFLKQDLSKELRPFGPSKAFEPLGDVFFAVDHQTGPLDLTSNVGAEVGAPAVSCGIG